MSPDFNFDNLRQQTSELVPKSERSWVENLTVTYANIQTVVKNELERIGIEAPEPAPIVILSDSQFASFIGKAIETTKPIDEELSHKMKLKIKGDSSNTMASGAYITS